MGLAKPPSGGHAAPQQHTVSMNNTRVSFRPVRRVAGRILLLTALGLAATWPAPPAHAQAGTGANVSATDAAPRARPRRGLEDFVLESEAMKMIVRPSAQEIEVRFLDAPLLRYSMAPTNYKPYVKEFRTLKGRNLLLDSPPDHVHHHGLMYAITVNGTNFWEEQKDPGVQRAAPLPMRYVGKSPEGRPLALFSHQTAWLASQHRHTTNALPVALLLETRTLSLTVDTAAGEVALRWQADFTAGRAADSVQLSGAAYHGLGLRFVRDFDLRAKHLNSENTPYSAEQKWDVIPARWAATQGRIGGHDVMAAIFASPQNAGESHFFSMLNAFAYLSATQNLDRAPLTYKRGDRFKLDYLVVLRDDHPAADALEARYQKWLKELTPPAGK